MARNFVAMSPSSHAVLAASTSGGGDGSDIRCGSAVDPAHGASYGAKLRRSAISSGIVLQGIHT